MAYTEPLLLVQCGSWWNRSDEATAILIFRFDNRSDRSDRSDRSGSWSMVKFFGFLAVHVSCLLCFMACDSHGFPCLGLAMLWSEGNQAGRNPRWKASRVWLWLSMTCHWIAIPLMQIQWVAPCALLAPRRKYHPSAHHGECFDAA